MEELSLLLAVEELDLKPSGEELILFRLKSSSFRRQWKSPALQLATEETALLQPAMEELVLLLSSQTGSRC